MTNPRNRNYCAIVVALTDFVELPNCDNVKAAIIFGNSIIVSKAESAGAVGLYFPAETQLTKEFLGANNLFRKAECGNADPDKKGFFEEHGRVKTLKFRGHKSEGFWIPIQSLAYTGAALHELTVGSELDFVGDHEICRKYVPAGNTTRGRVAKSGRQPRIEDRIVGGQFRFHIDTENLRRNIHKIEPHMWISISDKWHGTSAVFANILVQRELTGLDKLARWLGVRVADSEYGYTWSSRRVIKGVGGSAKADSVHFYGSDIWGGVARQLEHLVPKGYTIYGEIVGFTEDGSAIQKGYAYGCEPKAHRFVVYRITSTNPDGRILEFSWRQMSEFCQKMGLEMVKELWFGRAADFHQQIPGESLTDWQRGFLANLEHTFVKDQMCQHNGGKVPAEGVVVKIDSLDEAIAFKCKNFKFLERETKSLDAGEVDVETAQDGEVAA